MLYFSVDPRDGGPRGGVCDTCCCQPMSLRPGETNLMRINYATWSLPIMPPGIMQGGFDYDVETILDACPTNSIDGQQPPGNGFISAATPIGTPVDVDISATATPVGGTFTYSILPLQGPFNGTATIDETAGVITYTPNASFSGWDVIWYEQTDQYGRKVVYSVTINGGNVGAAVPPMWIADKPFIDRTRVCVNERTQEVSFPIYMPLTCRGCEVYRLTIRQTAQDCSPNTFIHLSCYDIRCKDCC